MEKERPKVPMSSILSQVLDPPLYKKYQKKLGFTPTSDYLYQWALISLNESNPDKAISFMISSLDIERKHAPTLHLIKSMVVGLGKDFYENGGSNYKQKHSDFRKLIRTLKKKIMGIQKKNKAVKKQIREREKEIDESFFLIRPFKKRKYKTQLIVLNDQMNDFDAKIRFHKKELKKVKHFQKNEEYSKILGTILEICVLPKRYAWAMKNNPES